MSRVGSPGSESGDLAHTAQKVRLQPSGCHPLIFLGPLCLHSSVWSPVLPAPSSPLPSFIPRKPPPAACSTASGKLSVSEASFPYL